MATRTTVTLIDDLDGTVADESVEFGLDGRAFEIDLSAANAAALRETLTPYVAAARRTGRPGSSGSSEATWASVSLPAPAAGKVDPSDRNRLVRAWAREHGMALAERGRLPGRVVAAYEADDPSLAVRVGDAG